MEGLKEKVDNKVEIVEGVLCETKIEEMQKAWKKEQEDEKVNFAEVVKQQIQEKTKDAVIKVIKEKEELVRDTIDKKKCLVIYGISEKKFRIGNARKIGSTREPVVIRHFRAFIDSLIFIGFH